MPLLRKILLLSIVISTTLLYYRLTTTSTMGSTPDKPIRLAILLNDTPQPKTLARVGNYHAVFSELLSAAVAPEPLESQLTITSHDVVNDLDSYPALEDVDALLLTGSKHTAFEDDPWILKLVEYTKKALDTGRVKVIGVCFGQQIVGRALGAPLGRSDKGWEVAVTESKLTEKGKEIFQLDKMVWIVPGTFEG
jgi:GMP synthase-like glutamine amidotransferase